MLQLWIAEPILLPHKEMNSEIDLAIDFWHLADLIRNILGFRHDELPRIWRSLLNDIQRFPTKSSYPRNKLCNHPALWDWQFRAGFYGFAWRTLQEHSFEGQNILKGLRCYSNWPAEILEKSSYTHL